MSSTNSVLWTFLILGIGNIRVFGLYQTAWINHNQEQNFKRSTDSFCTQGQGIFPHPKSCRLYVQCAPGGQQFVKPCPPDTLFNSVLSVCDHPANVPSCDGDNRRVHPVAVGPRNVILYRDRTTKSREGCKEGSVYPHPYDCNKYEVCLGGTLQEEKCGPGKNFDAEKLACHSKVNCGTRISARVRYFVCHPRFSYVSPHPDSCEKFIECENGKLLVKDCGSGETYNPKIKRCDNGNQFGNCSNGVFAHLSSDTHRESAEYGRSLHGNDFPTCSSKLDFIAADPEFCNKFKECDRGALFTKECGPGTVYNRYQGVCDWNYNTRETAAGACGGYLECQTGKYRHVTCSNGQHYSHRKHHKCTAECFGLSTTMTGRRTEATTEAKTTKLTTLSTMTTVSTTTKYTTTVPPTTEESTTTPTVLTTAKATTTLRTVTESPFLPPLTTPHTSTAEIIDSIPEYGESSES